MSTSAQPMTADELMLLPRGEWRCELVAGELRKMTPSGFEHGVIAGELASLLAQHVRPANLGLVCGAETGFLLASDPDTVRAPDVAFVSLDRIPAPEARRAFFPGPPDLAVEIVSPSDRLNEVDEKVEDWLRAGAGEVWVVNPRSRTVTVYRSATEILVLTSGDELNGGEVIPGFCCAISKIFVD